MTHAARPRVSSQPASHLTLEGLTQTTLFSALTHAPPGHPTFLVSLRGAPSRFLRSLLPFLSSLSTPVLHPSTPPTRFHLFQSFTTLRSTDNSEEPGSSRDPSSKLPAYCTHPRGLMKLTQHSAVSWAISLTCCCATVFPISVNGNCISSCSVQKHWHHPQLLMFADNHSALPLKCIQHLTTSRCPGPDEPPQASATVLSRVSLPPSLTPLN